MATIAGGLKKREMPLITAGTHVATIYRFMNLGTRIQVFQGIEKETPDTVIRITFEVTGEKHQFTYRNDDGVEETVEKPLVIDKEFNLTMGPKSKLRPFVEGIIGTPLTDDEAYAFDLEQLIGKSCLVSIAHKPSKKDGRIFANIISTAPLMKGMEAPALYNKISVFDINTCTKEEFDALPQFLREKTEVSDEYKKRFNPQTSELKDEDVPF